MYSFLWAQFCHFYIGLFDLKYYYTVFRDQLNSSFEIAVLVGGFFVLFLHLILEGHQSMVLAKLGNAYKITEQ